MLKAAAGDRASFDLLVERHQASVVNHLYRVVHSRDVAEDLAQDVFIRVFRSRARYRPNAKFSTWLYHITTNIGLNWRRDSRHEVSHLRLDQEIRHARKFEVRDPLPRADEMLMRECHAREVREAIERLPSKQLEAVLLHKYECMDYVEIAQALGCSIQALKSLLFRAYETLRERLAHFSPEAERNASLLQAVHRPAALERMPANVVAIDARVA